MIILPRLLLLSFYLFSRIYAKESNEAIKWLQKDRSVLIFLETPDLFFFSPGSKCAHNAMDYPGAFIFNFTLTHDRLTLLLNDEPILPRTNPYSPPPLRAHQTAETEAVFAQKTCIGYAQFPVMDLDYFFSVDKDPTDGTSQWNTHYNPRIQVDVLGASPVTLPGHNTRLTSDSQKRIWISLESVRENGPNDLYVNIPLKIGSVSLVDPWYASERLQGRRTCYLWSWICPDRNRPPYYEHIYREDFDRYGRKGSLRHFLTSRWGNLLESKGFWQAIVWVAVCGSLILSPFVYALSRGMLGLHAAAKDIVDVYRKRQTDVDKWLTDEELEEIEVLLKDDNKCREDSAKFDKRVLADHEEKGGEKTSVKESLPSLPYLLEKMEKN